MGFGEAAKAALSKAVEALQAIAEVKAIVQQVQLASANFERRIESRIEALETRIRELERENAKLNGQVLAAYADSLKTVFFDHNRERVREDETHHAHTGSLTSGSLAEASSVSVK